MKFDIQRQGRKWTHTEITQKYHELCPEKIELVGGKMFWTDEQRLNMLRVLLENVAMDAAVSLGDPALWKQAIDERLKPPAAQGTDQRDDPASHHVWPHRLPGNAVATAAARLRSLRSTLLPYS